MRPAPPFLLTIGTLWTYGSLGRNGALFLLGSLRYNGVL